MGVFPPAHFLAPLGSGVAPLSFTTRDRQGITHPYAAAATGVAYAPAYDPFNYSFPVANRTMADMDGDGLADWVIATGCVCDLAQPTTSAQVFVLPNRGDGRFGIGPGSPNTATPGTIGSDLSGYGAAAAGLFSDNNVAGSFGLGSSQPLAGGNDVFAFADLNGDGMADFAILHRPNIPPVAAQPPSVTLCLRTGPTLDVGFYSCMNQSLPTVSGQDSLQIADVHGAGINAAVVVPADGSPSTAYFVSPDGTQPPGPDGTVAPRDGLLTQIMQGTGLTTRLTYASVANGMNAGLALPVPQWVVQSVVTDNGLAGTPQGLSVTMQYQYLGPIYDPRDRAFLGFQDVIATRPGTPNAPELHVRTRFATDTCARRGDCTGTPDTS
jgi:hypothetical protein